MILKILATIILFLFWLWGSMAVFIAGPESLIIRSIILAIYIGSVPVAFYFSKTFWQSFYYHTGMFTLLFIWWLTLSPTNEKAWAPDVAHIPHGTIEGDILTLHNVRNFDYKTETDFSERWETRSYDLSQLKSIDLFLSYWGSPLITHTILSWGFSNGDQLAVSIETRKDKSQQYSAIKGFFKQFTLAYVAADERDVIRKRTHIWKEQVHVYRLNAPKERLRASLESYLSHMNRLVKKPEFYHALTMNCTSTIRMHSETSPDRMPFDWRFIVNGYIDEMLYENKTIRHELPFSDIRQQSRIDLAMQKDNYSDFSRYLRKVAKIE